MAYVSPSNQKQPLIDALKDSAMNPPPSGKAVSTFNDALASPQLLAETTVIASACIRWIQPPHKSRRSWSVQNRLAMQALGCAQHLFPGRWLVYVVLKGQYGHPH